MVFDELLKEKIGMVIIKNIGVVYYHWDNCARSMVIKFNAKDMDGML